MIRIGVGAGTAEVGAEKDHRDGAGQHVLRGSFCPRMNWRFWGAHPGERQRLFAAAGRIGGRHPAHVAAVR